MIHQGMGQRFQAAFVRNRDQGTFDNNQIAYLCSHRGSLLITIRINFPAL